MKETVCKFCDKKSCAVERLTDNELEIINENSNALEIKQHEIIYRQGTVTNHIIYIKSGIVKEYITSEDGTENIIRIVKAPSYLGLLSNIKNSEHFYSVSSLTNVEACYINKKTFTDLIESNGKFAKEILDSLRQNELYAYHCNVNLKHKQVTGRVADTLLFLADQIYEKDEFDICLSRSELASLIGASRENVTRVLFAFQEDKIIGLNKRNVQILDRDRLNLIKING